MSDQPTEKFEIDGLSLTAPRYRVLKWLAAGDVSRGLICIGSRIQILDDFLNEGFVETYRTPEPPRHRWGHIDGAFTMVRITPLGRKVFEMVPPDFWDVPDWYWNR